MLAPLLDRDVPLGIARAGAKAATLARLAQAGLPVPDGFVVEADHFREWQASEDENHVPPDLSRELTIATQEHFGDAAVAVRSSALDEDQAEASFAGQYTSVLDVRGEAAIEDAVVKCWRSARDTRVAAYRTQTAGATTPAAAMAVLVQRLVRAKAAGVAFTADPLTGERGETIVSAVPGGGERLVAGQANADEWVVQDTRATCRAAPHAVLDPSEAVGVAELARRVEAELRRPVDIEWALDQDGLLWLLQARPITALPDSSVGWDPPGPGGWSRTFRFGEWLGEPPTPSAAAWLLPRLEDGLWAELDKRIGLPFRPAPSYALVNGWFYASMNFWNVNPLRVIWQLLRRRTLSRLVAAIAPAHFPGTLEYWLDGWHRALPAHRQLAGDAAQRLDRSTPSEVVDVVDELCAAAGRYFVWVGVLGGWAYKTEVALADFYRRHLSASIGGSHQRLLVGLSGPVVPPAHAVTSLDWAQPTLGELTDLPTDMTIDVSRVAQVAADREQAETSARRALAAHARLARRFEGYLDAAQRAVQLRDVVVEPFTLAWPTMRRALLRLGHVLCERHVIDRREDVFFLTRDELLVFVDPGVQGRDLRAMVAERRRLWHAQRRLAPPATLGRSWIMRGLMGMAQRLRDERPEAVDESQVILSGLPASPGRAIAPVRVIRTPEAFHELRQGEVLVAPATTPAWSILFGRAAAVVTDSGSPLAHTSLVAREFGIPAVVATGCATTRLHTGELVTVDGNVGCVLRLREVH
jgi:rifampicin phosphotransferase